MNVIDKLYFLPGALLLSLIVSAQTTNTTCTTYNYGPNGQINCTSTTQPSAYQEGQAMGQAGANLGGAIGLMIARHNQKTGGTDGTIRELSTKSPSLDQEMDSIWHGG